MGRIDLMDQLTLAYRLDRKLSVRFYLRIFFDLMIIACANSYLIYNMKHSNKLSFLDCKIVAPKKPNSIPSRPKKGSANVEAI